MSFGLESAPATVEPVTVVKLSAVKWRHVFVQLNDIVVFFKKPQLSLNLQGWSLFVLKTSYKHLSWKIVAFLLSESTICA